MFFVGLTTTVLPYILIIGALWIFISVSFNGKGMDVVDNDKIITLNSADELSNKSIDTKSTVNFFDYKLSDNKVKEVSDCDKPSLVTYAIISPQKVDSRTIDFPTNILVSKLSGRAPPALV